MGDAVFDLCSRQCIHQLLKVVQHSKVYFPLLFVLFNHPSTQERAYMRLMQYIYLIHGLCLPLMSVNPNKLNQHHSDGVLFTFLL